MSASVSIETWRNALWNSIIPNQIARLERLRGTKLRHAHLMICPILHHYIVVLSISLIVFISGVIPIVLGSFPMCIRWKVVVFAFFLLFFVV